MAASLTILIVGLRLCCSLAQFLTNVLEFGVIVDILIDGKSEEVIYRPLIRLLYSHNLIIKIFLPLAGITASQRSFGRVQSAAEEKFFGLIRTTKYQSEHGRYKRAYVSTKLHFVFTVDPSTTGPPKATTPSR